jgi:hypothetical protein
MNKKLKIGLLLLTVIILIVSQAQAQNQNMNQLQNEQYALQLRSAEVRMGQRVEMLKKNLALTSDQLSKVKKIERRNMEEENRVRERALTGNNMGGMKNTGQGFGNNQGLDQRSLNYDLNKLRKEADDEIAKILDETQKTKFAESRLRDEKIREGKQVGTKPNTQANNTKPNTQANNTKPNTQANSTQINNKKEDVPAKKKNKKKKKKKQPLTEE